MKTPINAAFFGPATGKLYVLALCLLAGYFCPAQSKPTITTIFYINVPQEYDKCYLGNARLLVEGIDSQNSNYWQAHAYSPGQVTLIMQGVGEFRVTLIGLSCPVVQTYAEHGDGNPGMNIRPSARLRCYGGRFNVTLR